MISRSRAVDRINSRLATLAQPMSSTNITAAKSTRSGRRVSPTVCSWSGMTVALQSAFNVGCSFAVAAAIARISSRAFASVIVGRSRATTE